MYKLNIFLDPSGTYRTSKYENHSKVVNEQRELGVIIIGLDTVCTDKAN